MEGKWSGEAGAAAGAAVQALLRGRMSAAALAFDAHMVELCGRSHVRICKCRRHRLQTLINVSCSCISSK